MKAALLIITLLMISGAAYAQTPVSPAPAGIEEAYLAKDDGEGKAGEQVTEFQTTDVPIYCVVLLESNQAALVKMTFVAVAVAGVKPETKVVTASYTTREAQNKVNFTGRPDGKWTPGKYRVDLFLNGKMARNLVFEIKSSAAGVQGAASFQPPKRRKGKN